MPDPRSRSRAPRDIFIVGAPRSGTTWLQRLIASHPEVASPQETFFFSHYASPLVAQFSKHRQHVDAVKEEQDNAGETTRRVISLATIFHDDDLTAWIQAGWDLVRERSLELKPGSTRVAEKSPSHGAHLALVRRTAPDCQIVHIIRDPRRTARSSQQAPWSSGALTELLSSARQWQRLVRSARDLGVGADDYLEVRYEELTKNTDVELGRILRQLDLELSDADRLRIIADVADKSRSDSAELVLGGHAKVIGLRPAEPTSFDIRSRGAHAELTPYEEWLVLKNAPIARELGYTSRARLGLVRRAFFNARSMPMRLYLRVRRGRRK